MHGFGRRLSRRLHVTFGNDPHQVNPELPTLVPPRRAAGPGYPFRAAQIMPMPHTMSRTGQ